MGSAVIGLEQGFGPVLIGMRGSGKSSIAAPLAARLQMAAVDADAELERQTERSIATIFAEDGEPGFRQLERKLLLDDLLLRQQTVVATGGGAVLDSDTRARLQQRLTVWLHAPIAALAQRIGGTDRPSLTGGAIDEELSHVFAVREPLYREAAQLMVDTAELSVEQIVERIYRIATGERT